jgi:Domain of unknown function (DUF4861)
MMQKIIKKQALFALTISAIAFTGQASAKPTGAIAHVDLRVTTTSSPNETYVPVKALNLPATHIIGNKYFPYEGIGWENELIGYRIYIDERSVADVFGKKTPGVALSKMDYRNKYHEMSSWGMDVMHVGPSQGIGGLGLIRQGKLNRFGKDAKVRAEVIQQKGTTASFRLIHSAIPLDGGMVGSVSTRYSIRTGSPLTHVQVEKASLGQNSFASGLVWHAGNRLIEGSPTKKGGWTYIAAWGENWSQNKDALGIALFYRDGEASGRPIENEAYPIVFTTAKPSYAFAAVWELGPEGVKTESDFRAWLGRQVNSLEKMRTK